MTRINAVKECVETLIRGRQYRRSPESNGYYSRVPRRVGEWVLESNTEDQLVWMTTATDGPKKTLHIKRDEDNQWFVSTHHGGITAPCVVSSIQKWTDEFSEIVDRRHAFWHAQDVMMGRTRGQAARGNLQYFFEENRPEVTDVDIFFDQSRDIRRDPFKAHLQE